jgi:hypothetical protein
VVRHKLAGYLRVLAYFLDRKEYISARWHKASVEATNQYIAQTERYIIALEATLERTIGKPAVCKLRQRFKRLNTKALMDAGAWN